MRRPTNWCMLRNLVIWLFPIVVPPNCQPAAHPFVRSDRMTITAPEPIALSSKKTHNNGPAVFTTLPLVVTFPSRSGVQVPPPRSSTTSGGRPYWYSPTDKGPFHQSSSVYELVGQTFVSHERTHLRVVDIPLIDRDQRIGVEAGDVLGLFFPGQNPIGWSPVPCGASGVMQHYLAADGPSVASGQPMEVGRRIQLTSAPMSDRSPCRHYSYMAIFGE